MSLSIITVSWNHRDEIGAFLDAVDETRKGCSFPVEMVLVDNASQDGTADFVAEHYPWVKLVRSAANTGFAVGCNLGMEAASGDYFLMFNPDAFAKAEALEAMMDFLKKHPEVGAVGCTLLHDDGKPQISAYADMGPLSYIMNQSAIYPVWERVRKVLYSLGLLQRTKPRRVGWLMGSCIMTPRAVFEKIGGIEPSYFMYCEDCDWCARIREAGWEVVHLPTVSVRHRQKGSTKRAPEFTFRRVYRSVVHYANRNIRGPRRELFHYVMLGDFYLRLPLYRLVAMMKPARREAIAERIRSVRRMIDIIKARDPDLYDDPPPRK